MTIFLPIKISNDVIKILVENKIDFYIKYFNYIEQEDYIIYNLNELIIERIPIYPESRESSIGLELSLNYDIQDKKYYVNFFRLYDDYSSDNYIIIDETDIIKIKNIMNTFNNIIKIINDNIDYDLLDMYYKYLKL